MLLQEDRFKRAFLCAGPSTVAAAGTEAVELCLCFAGKADAGFAPTDELWLSLESEADFAEGASLAGKANLACLLGRVAAALLRTPAAGSVPSC